MTTVNCFANIFTNMWIEGNAQGVLIDATPTYNSFIGGTITANTTNFTDNAKYTSVVNTQIGANQFNQVPTIIIQDKGNASSIAEDVVNNTSFAHTASTLGRYRLLNATDTSDVLTLSNAGNGAVLNMVSTQATLQTASSK